MITEYEKAKAGSKGSAFVIADARIEETNPAESYVRPAVQDVRYKPDSRSTVTPRCSDTGSVVSVQICWHWVVN